jgi:MSHA biogenesis protein MshK
MNSQNWFWHDSWVRGKMAPIVLLCLCVTGLCAGLAHAAESLDNLPDPTRPGGGGGGGGASGVTSILITPARKQAVINGRTVVVGDRVGDAVVVDIQPYEVILNRGGRESRMRLVPRLDKLQGEGGSS